MIRKIFFIGFLMSIGLQIFAQGGRGNYGGERPKGSVSGTLIDDLSKQPVLYATVALYKQKDSTLQTGTMSQDLGKFTISDVPAGKYYMIVKFIGYEKYTSQSIVVRPPNLNVQLGTIKLKQSSTNLQGVEIVAEKTYVEYKIDKKVVNVGKDINASGGTAVEALENVPSVTVDVDGNVSLRGSTSFTVFVNGKPTPLSGTDALQQIPVGAIKNIEVITNPSAKYDPDGLSGIINVVLKENVKLGLNGMIEVNGSNQGSMGINGVLSYNIGKFNVFVGGNYNDNQRPGTGLSEIETSNNDTTDYRITDLHRNRNRKRYSVRAGFDYMPNKKNTFTFEGSVGGNERNKDFSSQIHEYNNPLSYDIYSISTNPGSSKSKFYSFSANYEHKFDDLGSNLQALLYFEDEDDRDDDLSLEYLSDANWIGSDNVIEGFKTYQNEIEPQFRIQLDYTKRYKNKSRIEAGLQARIRPEQYDYDYEIYQNGIGWVLQPEYGSELNFQRDIYSAYGTYSGEHKTWGYQLGMRGEYTYRDVRDLSREYSFKINRFDFFPTLHFSKKLPHDQQMLLSYSRRIQRPGGWELEPFTRYISSNFRRKGNPELQPEYTNNFELSYQKSIKQSFISVEGYYRSTNNVTSRVQSMDSLGVITMTFENLDRDASTGIELMVNLRVVKWMDINISGNYYYFQIFGNSETLGDVNSSSDNFDMLGNAMFTLGKSTRLQLNGFYRGASVTAQGNRKPFFVTSVSLRQDFFKRKLSVSLNVRDVFQTSIWEFSIYGDGFSNHVRFNPVSPTITLNLNYRINNYKEKRRPGDGEGGMGGDGIL